MELTLDQSYFTTGQIAKICSVAPRTVAKWVRLGRLSCHRYPGVDDNLDTGIRRVTRVELLRFLRHHHFPLNSVSGAARILIVGSKNSFPLHLYLKEEDGYDYRYSQSGFDAGMDVYEFTPEVIVLDFGWLGRSESIQIAHSLRNTFNRFEGVLVGLVGEDEIEQSGLEEKYRFSLIFKRPFDVQVVAERIKSLVRLSRIDTCSNGDKT